tara:strand:- start:1127 stop:1351 length:225 start_codon:yes stop_codon:yes gene_type:complete
MNIELFILGGYGIFVWPAFVFAFLSCFFLYKKTKKEFTEQEKIYFNEFKHLESKKIHVEKSRKNSEEILPVSSF